jgi:hypothetical protein
MSTFEEEGPTEATFCLKLLTQRLCNGRFSGACWAMQPKDPVPKIFFIILRAILEAYVWDLILPIDILCVFCFSVS